MHPMLIAALTVLVCATITACATPAYYQNRAVCRQEWLGQIPPDYRQVLVNRERRVRIPDGTETCTTTGNTTRCKKGMRTAWIPYTAVRTFDANAPQREARIRQCAQTRCLKIYGNSECRT